MKADATQVMKTPTDFFLILFSKVRISNHKIQLLTDRITLRCYIIVYKSSLKSAQGKRNSLHTMVRIPVVNISKAKLNPKGNADYPLHFVVVSIKSCPCGHETCQWLNLIKRIWQISQLH